MSAALVLVASAIAREFLKALCMLVSSLGTALGVEYLVLQSVTYMVQEDYGARVGISSLDVGWKVLALFGRVGDGIHKKLADVAADLVGKLKYVLEDCSNRNPACSADNGELSSSVRLLRPPKQRWFSLRPGMG